MIAETARGETRSRGRGRREERRTGEKGGGGRMGDLFPPER